MYQYKSLFINLTLSQTTIFYPSKLKEFTDDNFIFDENGRKLSKWVENSVGKREIARYEQFLLFPQCFKKRLLLQTRKNQGLFGKGLREISFHVHYLKSVNPFPNKFWFSHVFCTSLLKTPLEKVNCS